MAFGSNVCATFATGVYTVKRYAAGTTVDGQYTPPAPTTLTFSGSVQPVTGRALRDLREGLSADDVKTIYTATRLYVTSPSHDQPDIVVIGGENYRVTKVEHFNVISDHFRVTVERMANP